MIKLHCTWPSLHRAVSLRRAALRTGRKNDVRKDVTIVILSLPYHHHHLLLSAHPPTFLEPSFLHWKWESRKDVSCLLWCLEWRFWCRFYCFACYMELEVVIGAATEWVTQAEREAAPAHHELVGSMSGIAREDPVLHPAHSPGPALPGLGHNDTGRLLFPRAWKDFHFLRPQMCLFGQPQTGSG